MNDVAKVLIRYEITKFLAKKWDSAESRNVNLKSNTMKNTLQRYDEFHNFPNI